MRSGVAESAFIQTHDPYTIIEKKPVVAYCAGNARVQGATPYPDTLANRPYSQSIRLLV